MTRCCVCGRFCTIADTSTDFAFGEAQEPPDDDFYCATCSEYEYQNTIKRGYPCTFWHDPDWNIRAAIDLGYLMVAPPMAAWHQWAKPDNIPDGYVVWPYVTNYRQLSISTDNPSQKRGNNNADND